MVQHLAEKIRKHSGNLQAESDPKYKKRTGLPEKLISYKQDIRCILSLKCLLNGIFSCSRCSLVQILLISQKFNSCVVFRQTDGRTDGRTKPLIELRVRN